MGSPNYNRLVGEGKAGLGKNELKRRVKQHNALAEKAFASVKGKEQLTAADVANIYRGIGLKNDAKLMQSIGDKTYSFPKKSTSSSPLIPGMGPQFSKAVRQTGEQLLTAAKKTGKLMHNVYVTIDSLQAGLGPGGVKPYNPFKSNALKVAKKNYKKLNN